MKLTKEIAERMLKTNDSELIRVAKESFPELRKMPKFEDLKCIKGWHIDVESDIMKTDISFMVSEINWNVYPTFELAKAAQVQAKLYQCYHAALEFNCPEWNGVMKNVNAKYGIMNIARIPAVIETSCNYVKFSFPSEELAEEFLDTHREDLETYIPLL